LSNYPKLIVKVNLKYILKSQITYNLPSRAKKHFICYIFGSVSVNTAKDSLTTGEP